MVVESERRIIIVGREIKGKKKSQKNSDEKKASESSLSKRNIGRPSKKGVEVSKVSAKRRRDSGGKEVVCCRIAFYCYHMPPQHVKRP